MLVYFICIRRLVRLIIIRGISFKQSYSFLLKILLNIVFILLCHTIVVSSLKTENCSNVIFERYFGYIPNRNLSHLIYRNTTFSHNVNLTKSCGQICKGETSCEGFVIDFRTLLCSLYEDIPERSVEFFQTELSFDLEKSFFIKTCFAENLSPCQNALPWQMDLVPLATINFSASAEAYNSDDEFRFHNATNVTSMEGCQSLCLTFAIPDKIGEQLSPSTAICRSAVYDFKEKTCILSQENRHLSPDVIISTKDDKVYMENRCWDEGAPHICDYVKNREEATYSPTEGFYTKNRRQCEFICSRSVDSSCRSYEYNRTSKSCKLSLGGSSSSMEILELLGNQTFEDAQNFEDRYYGTDCLDVKLFCLKNSMNAQVSVDGVFDGKIFDSNNKRCHFSDFHASKFNITISLIDQSKCRVLNEKPNEYSIVLQIQYHRNLTTAKDRSIKLSCTYIAPVVQRIRTSIEIQDAKDDSVSEITHNVVKADADSPTASIKIVDVDGRAVTKAKIGQVLYAQITLEETASSGTGLFITDCTALENDQKVQLLDHVGCPVNGSLFGAFKPVTDGNFKSLRAIFQGFKFQMQTRINLSCNVNFCYEFCQNMNCTNKVRKRSKRFFGSLRKSNIVEIGFEIIDS